VASGPKAVGKVNLVPSQWENGVPAFDAATLYPQFHRFQGSPHLRQTNRVKLVLGREAVRLNNLARMTVKKVKNIGGHVVFTASRGAGKRQRPSGLM